MRKAAKNSVERCGEHDQAVLRDFRRNVAGAVAFETVWGIAMGFVVFAVLVPAYLNALAAPKLLVGVVSAMFVICTPLQLFAEHLVGGVHRKRNSWLLWTSTGIAYIGCGLLGAVLPAEPTVIRIVVFTAMMAMFAAAVSIAWPVYNTILTDNFPVRRRGLLLGLRTFGLGIAGLAASVPARTLYHRWSAPDCYHIAMVIAGMCFIVSAACVLIIRDHPDPQRTSQYVKSAYTSIWRQLYIVLARIWLAPSYRVFVFFMILLLTAGSISPFLVTYATDAKLVSVGQERLFNVIFLVASLVSGLAIGALADRWGYKLAGIVIAGLTTAAFVTAGRSDQMWMIILAYGLHACAALTAPTILCNMSVELLPRISPAYLMAAGNMFALPALVIVPTVCGRLVDTYGTAVSDLGGYMPVFITAIVLAITGGLGMALLVQEPRTGKTYTIIKQLPRVRVRV